MASASKGYMSSKRSDDAQPDVDGSYPEDNGLISKVERSGPNICGSDDTSFLDFRKIIFLEKCFPLVTMPLRR